MLSGRSLTRVRQPRVVQIFDVELPRRRDRTVKLRGARQQVDDKVPVLRPSGTTSSMSKALAGMDLSTQIAVRFQLQDVVGPFEDRGRHRIPQPFLRRVIGIQTAPPHEPHEVLCCRDGQFRRPKLGHGSF